MSRGLLKENYARSLFLKTGVWKWATIYSFLVFSVLTKRKFSQTVLSLKPPELND
jgi:hypothetical protein